MVAGTVYLSDFSCAAYFAHLCITLLRTYGSGYPGVRSRGINGLGFPFYFWPVVWGGAAGAGGAAYLHSSEVSEDLLSCVALDSCCSTLQVWRPQ